MNTHSISAAAFAALYRQGKIGELIDVRTPAEFHSAHVTNARNVPLGELESFAARFSSPSHADEPVYLLCQSGGRGEQAGKLLRASVCDNAVNVAGGTAACQRAGMPMTYGHSSMSLERQVRIAAGGFVLLGAALSLLHPAFLVLPLFLGAGLLLSGLTDWCGLATLLAKMPWNRTTTR